MARSPAKRFFGTLIFILAAIAFITFVALLFLDAENLNDIPLVNAIPDYAKILGIGLAVAALLLAIIILVRSSKKEEEEMFFMPEPTKAQLAYSMDDFPEQPPAPGDGPAIEVYHLPSVARQKHAWDKADKNGDVNTYYFPRSVKHALYTNDYITIDHDGRKLKLRTLIAGPKDGQKAEMPPVFARYLDKLRKEQDDKAMAEEAAKYQDATPGDGGEFIEELEKRVATEPEPTPPIAREAIYYGYSGDNPPVETIPGIDNKGITLLHTAGVKTVARLLFEDPESLADRSGADAQTVKQWQAAAELNKVTGIGPQTAEALAKGGIGSIEDMLNMSAAAVCDAATKGGVTVSEKRAQAWQDAAGGLQRTKQVVPVA